MRFQSFRAHLLLLALASVLCPGAGSAADGAIEINQARAVAGGITPGDAPGFPVTLSVPGSYRLTSNLIVSDPNVNGIAITAAGPVSLDLNAFEIVGPVTCSGAGSAVSCAPAGSGNGIFSFSRVRVRHGTVRGFANLGVAIGDFSQIDDLLGTSNGHGGLSVNVGLVENSRAIQNGSFGIFVGVRGVVQQCISNQNGSGGIFTNFQAVIVGNAVSSNGSFGIHSGPGSVIRDNVASNNQGAGIVASQGSLVTHNSAYGNTGDGIDAGVGTLVSDNTASFNIVSGNSGTGIVADAGSSVQRNTATNNGIDGLYLIPSIAGTPPAAYLENAMDHNAQNSGSVGFPVAGGLNMGANYCDGAICP